MTGVRTPLATTTALELGQKLWRKQIIRGGKISYRGGEFDASPEYLDSVMTAYRDRAIGSVPFVFVDDKGSHSEAPERRRGKVVGLERTDAGIDALLQLSDDAEKLVEEDPQFGVSVLIKHDRTTGEGKFHPAVLCHVAGTYDPVLALAPWQEELAASNDAGDVLDLLTLTAPPESPPTTGALNPDKEAPVADTTDTLTGDEVRRFREWLATQAAPADPTDTDGDGDGDGDGEPELTDAELDAIAAAALDDHEQDTPELVAAAHADADELALANARLDAQSVALSNMTAKLDAAGYERERDDLVRTFGIPPRVVDLARPLMEGNGRTVALSNGRTADAGQIARDLLRECGRTFKALGLSQEYGTADGVDIDAEETPEQFVARVRAQNTH